ncbi:hypothetical protein ASE38_02145 [Cellulomonas sp. Root930]|nr:hypothetical protein ASE38_02145 [Cellulomonas sp. Root930]
MLVVNYHTASAVAQLVDSLVQRAGGVPVLLSVVDNSCDVDELAELRAIVAARHAHLAGATVTAAPSNLGYAAGNNLAWRALVDAGDDAEVDVVVVANPDVRIVEGTLAALGNFVDDVSPALVSARTISDGTMSSGHSLIQKMSGRSARAATDQAGRGWLRYPDGHFLAASSETWRALGGFAEVFFLYCEEVDLAMRAAELLEETRLLTSDGITVEHIGGLSTAEGRDRVKSRLTLHHSTRSRVLLYRRHRSLHAYLPVMIAGRIAWAALLAIKGEPSHGWSVLSGAAAGVRAPRSPTLGVGA